MKRPPRAAGDEGPARGGESSKNGKGRWGGRKRNEQRLGSGRGGGALSLAAFANAKSRSNGYNPALIKKQKEFYRNAKVIGKYKRSRKGQDQSNRPSQFHIHENEIGDAQNVSKPHHNKKRTAQSLKEEYEKKRAEVEMAKKEREAMIQAKKEEREKSEAKRKELREKMFKKTRSGQPVMKYRIEHMLETVLGSSSK